MDEDCPKHRGSWSEAGRQPCDPAWIAISVTTTRLAVALCPLWVSVGCALLSGSEFAWVGEEHVLPAMIP